MKTIEVEPVPHPQVNVRMTKILAQSNHVRSGMIGFFWLCAQHLGSPYTIGSDGIAIRLLTPVGNSFYMRDRLFLHA